MREKAVGVWPVFSWSCRRHGLTKMTMMPANVDDFEVVSDWTAAEEGRL